MKLRPLLTAGATLGIAIASQAQPLPVGFTALSGTAGIPGTVLEDKSTPYDFTDGAQVLKGNVQSRVVRADGTGQLLFLWRIKPDPTSTGSINAFRMGQYCIPFLDANWSTTSLGDVGPNLCHNFGDGYLNFNFTLQAIGPTQSSKFFWIVTDATNYDQTGHFDLVSTNNGHSSGMATYAPVHQPRLGIRVSPVEICWDSLDYATYRVEYSSELTSNSWVILQDCVPSGGAQTCITNNVGPGEPQRFYRVAATNCVAGP